MLLGIKILKVLPDLSKHLFKDEDNADKIISLIVTLFALLTCFKSDTKIPFLWETLIFPEMLFYALLSDTVFGVNLPPNIVLTNLTNPKGKSMCNPIISYIFKSLFAIKKSFLL